MPAKSLFIVLLFFHLGIASCDEIRIQSDCYSSLEMCWWDSAKEGSGHACTKFSGSCPSIKTNNSNDCTQAGMGNKCFFKTYNSTNYYCFDNCSALNKTDCENSETHPYCNYQSVCRGCDARGDDCTKYCAKSNNVCDLGCGTYYNHANKDVCESDPTCVWVIDEVIEVEGEPKKATGRCTEYTTCSNIKLINVTGVVDDTSCINKKCIVLDVLINESRSLSCVDGCAGFLDKSSCQSGTSFSCYWDSYINECLPFVYCGGVQTPDAEDCNTASNISNKCSWIKDVGCIDACGMLLSVECRNREDCLWNNNQNTPKCENYTSCAAITRSEICNQESHERCYWHSGTCTEFSKCGGLEESVCNEIRGLCKWNSTACVDACSHVQRNSLGGSFDCENRADCYVQNTVQNTVCRDKILDDLRCNVDFLNYTTCYTREECEWNNKDYRCELAQFPSCKLANDRASCLSIATTSSRTQCWYDDVLGICRGFSGSCADIHDERFCRGNDCTWVESSESTGECVVNVATCLNNAGEGLTEGQCNAAGLCYYDSTIAYPDVPCIINIRGCSVFENNDTCKLKAGCWWRVTGYTEEGDIYNGECIPVGVCRRYNEENDGDGDEDDCNSNQNCWWEIYRTSGVCKPREAVTNYCDELKNKKACDTRRSCWWDGENCVKFSGLCEEINSSKSVNSSCEKEFFCQYDSVENAAVGTYAGCIQVPCTAVDDMYLCNARKDCVYNETSRACLNFAGCAGIRSETRCFTTKRCLWDRTAGNCLDEIYHPFADVNGKGCSSYNTSQDVCNGDIYTSTSVGTGCIWNSYSVAEARGVCQNFTGCSGISHLDFGGQFLDPQTDCMGKKGCRWRSVKNIETGEVDAEDSYDKCGPVGWCEDGEACSTYRESVTCDQQQDCFWRNSDPAYLHQCQDKTCNILNQAYCESVNTTGCEWVIGSGCVPLCSSLNFDECWDNSRCFWTGESCQTFKTSNDCALVPSKSNCDKLIKRGCFWLGSDAVNIELGECHSNYDTANMQVRACDDYKNAEQCRNNSRRLTGGSCYFFWNADHTSGHCTYYSDAYSNCSWFLNKAQCNYPEKSETPNGNDMDSFTTPCFWNSSRVDGQHCQAVVNCSLIPDGDCVGLSGCDLGADKGCVQACSRRDEYTCVFVEENNNPCGWLGSCIINCSKFKSPGTCRNYTEECVWEFPEVTTPEPTDPTEPFEPAELVGPRCVDAPKPTVYTGETDDSNPCYIDYDIPIRNNATACNKEETICRLGCVWNSNNGSINVSTNGLDIRPFAECLRFRSCSDIFYPRFLNAQTDCVAKGCFWTGDGCSSESPPPSKRGLSAGAIAGIAVGAALGVLLIVVAIIIVIFVLKKRKGKGGGGGGGGGGIRHTGSEQTIGYPQTQSHDEENMQFTNNGAYAPQQEQPEQQPEQQQQEAVYENPQGDSSAYQ